MENGEMTEREMLEFAAKAYGFGSDSGGFIWTESEYPRGSSTNGALWNYKGWHDTAELWNPLTDDGDALRLAVALGMNIDVGVNPIGFTATAVIADYNSVFVDEYHEENSMKATRRAIVKAAAEIGKRMVYQTGAHRMTETKQQHLEAPEGWQLVPMEPTTKMVMASGFLSEGRAREVWADMLAAAPKLEDE